MSKMLQDLVVIAKYDDKYIDECLASLGKKYPIKVIDTSSGGHPTGAYIKAFREHKAENYLFLQDSLFAHSKDYLEAFKEKMPKMGAVAWGLFGFAYDSDDQKDWIKSQYDGTEPDYGIFGPIFYTNRKSLEALDKKGLLPMLPENKLQAQGNERMWAWAFKNAGLPVEYISMWSKESMQNGSYPIFRKTFAGRP